MNVRSVSWPKVAIAALVAINAFLVGMALGGGAVAVSGAFDWAGLAGGFLAVFTAWLAVRWESRSQDEREARRKIDATREAVEVIRMAVSVLFIKMGPIIRSTQRALEQATTLADNNLTVSVEALRAGWLKNTIVPQEILGIAGLPATTKFFVRDRIESIGTNLTAIIEPPSFVPPAQMTRDLRIFSYCVAIHQALLALDDVLNHIDEFAAKHAVKATDGAKLQRDKIKAAVATFGALAEAEPG